MMIMPLFLLRWSSVAAGLVLLIWGVGGAASAQSPEDAGMIQEIKPTLRGLNVSVNTLTIAYGQRLALSIIVIGPDGNEDQSRASNVDFVWTASYGELEVHDDTTSATYVAPRFRAGDTVTVSAGSECIGNTTDCTATFAIRVLPPPPPYVRAENPLGEIPTSLVDAQGHRYEVFTPEEGGRFDGGEFWVSASSGDVKNGEFIGVRMFENGPASNAGMSHHRYTLSGNQYRISVIDAEGAPVSPYSLNGTVTVCIPVPDELRINVADLEIVAKNHDGTLTPMGSVLQITSLGAVICGNTSALPATVAIGLPNKPPELDPAEMLPATGGTAPTSRGIIAWALFVGAALIATGTFASTYRHRPHEGIR